MCTRPVELARYRECTRQGLKVETPAGFAGGRWGRLISSLFASCSNAKPTTIQDHTHTILLSAVALVLTPSLFLLHTIPLPLVHLATRLTYSRTNLYAQIASRTHRSLVMRIYTQTHSKSDGRALRRGTKTRWRHARWCRPQMTLGYATGHARVRDRTRSCVRQRARHSMPLRSCVLL